MRTSMAMGVGLAAALAACDAPPPDLVAMKIELNALKQEMEHLRYQTEELDPRVRSAEQMALQSIDEREAPLAIDCAARRPAVLATRLAPVTVVCEDIVRAAGNGRVRLKLGNPTSGRLDGVHLTVYVGDGAAQGRSETRLHVAAPGPVPPGAWKTVELELPAHAGAAVRDLAVRAQVDGITLAQR